MLSVAASSIHWRRVISPVLQSGSIQALGKAARRGTVGRRTKEGGEQSGRQGEGETRRGGGSLLGFGDFAAVAGEVFVGALGEELAELGEAGFALGFAVETVDEGDGAAGEAKMFG